MSPASFPLAVALTALTVVGATELTLENIEEKTAGKSMFIKFFAPWCGHCKSLKPAWDRLTADFADSPTAVVAEVDCAGAGQSLCEKKNVKGYPSLLYGDNVDELQKHEGGRTYEELKMFVDNNLGPQCGPEHLDLCSQGLRSKVESYLALSIEQLEARIQNITETLDQDAPLMKKAASFLRAQALLKGVIVEEEL